MRLVSIVLVFATLVLGCAPVAEETPFREIAGVRLLMNATLDPAADAIWDAVKTEMTLEETVDFEPQNDEEWTVVRNHAITLAESGNLLMIGSRRHPDPEWDGWSRDLIAAGEMAMRAAEAQDAERLFEIGGEIYRSCDGCHAKFWIGSGDFLPPEGPVVLDEAEPDE